MPYGAHVISLLEDALAESFQYHDGLDNFLRRSGVLDARLKAAREPAEERAKKSPRNFGRAPNQIPKVVRFASTPWRVFWRHATYLT
jgi:hypothetical protein